MLENFGTSQIYYFFVFAAGLHCDTNFLGTLDSAEQMLYRVPWAMAKQWFYSLW